MARNQVTLRPGTCPTCGAKVRLDRDRCPRCRAKLSVPDPAAVAARSRMLRLISTGLIAVFAVTLVALWFMREPAPSGTPAGPVPDPMAARRVAPETSDVPAHAADPVPLAERPFLDPSGRGYAAYAAGDYEAALARFQEAVERNPRDAESLSNLGQVLVRLNRAAEAVPFFQRAAAEIPDRWTYHFNMARAQGLLGRWPESIASYRRAQQLFPDDYATAFNLALTLHKSGDDAAAVEQYRKAIALEPNDPSFHMALGISYERLQKKSEAAAAYAEALRLSPEAPDADTVRAKIAALTQPSPAGA